MMQNMDSLNRFEHKKTTLINEIQKHPNCKIAIKKKTASNLFRYKIQDRNTANIYVTDFNNIITLDEQNLVLDVEGLATYEKIVDFCLQHGYLPTVAPELKHITISGAIVGIGIESTSYKYGFVHDGLIEAEVLLPSGNVVICNANNQYSDLFHALPNSYGTLGYILRAKIKLYPAKPYVKITVNKITTTKTFLELMNKEISNLETNFIEGLIFSKNELYLLSGKFLEQSELTDNIYKKIFYQLIRAQDNLILKTKDYIFRYDPDWFWNIPETPLYNFLRRVLPPFYRSSGFYKKYLDLRNRFLSLFKIVRSLNDEEEALIQDWQVEWDKGEALLDYGLSNIDLNGKPWAAIPIVPQQKSTLFPLQPGNLYFNLGCYCSSKRKNLIPYYNTKIMDNFCYSLGGLKMLYSSTFLSLEEFEKHYNGIDYSPLKNKYDPKNKNGELYQKVVLN